METITIILLSILIVLVIGLLLVVLLRKNNNGPIDTKGLTKDIRDEIDRSAKNITESSSSIKDQVGEANAKLLVQLSESIVTLKKQIDESVKTGFSTTGETMDKFVQKFAVVEESQKAINNLAAQIVTFEKILGNNKETGNFGEALLGQALFAYFGEDNKLYQLQYNLNGVTPDAVVFMPNEVICIDSKFPVHFYQQYLEATEDSIKQEALKNLLNAAKNQCKEVYTKYIIKGTTSDYACMFVPSDSLIALIHTKLPELIEYARKNQVILLSPSTIIPFISSLKNARLEFERNKNATKLYEELVKLQVDFVAFRTRWEAETNRISQLSKANDELTITVNKITKKFENISDMKLDEEE